MIDLGFCMSVSQPLPLVRFGQPLSYADKCVQYNESVHQKEQLAS